MPGLLGDITDKNSVGIFNSDSCDMFKTVNEILVKLSFNKNSQIRR